MAVPRIERKVYFYRWRTTGQPPFDPQEAARLIAELEFTVDGRYQELEDDELLCVWPARRSQYVRLQLGVVRKTGLPHIEQSGAVSPLNIRPNQGLVEQTHVVFFPNRIVGAEFNFYGPRVARFTEYLRQKFQNDLPRVNFEPLLRRDVQEQIQHFRDIRVLQLRVHREYLDLLSGAEASLPEALRRTEAYLGAATVELVLRPQKFSRGGLAQFQRAVDLVRTLVRNPRTREGVEVFKVRAEDDRTGKPEWFDLLKDHLIATRRVARQDDQHRAVNSASMYREIQRAYEQLRESLETAAGIGP